MSLIICVGLGGTCVPRGWFELGVLISKYVWCKEISDGEEGRIIIVGQTFRDKSVILANIYAPNDDNHVVFLDLESKLLESGGHPRGDSNIVLDQTQVGVAL